MYARASASSGGGHVRVTFLPHRERTPASERQWLLQRLISTTDLGTEAWDGVTEQRSTDPVVVESPSPHCVSNVIVRPTSGYASHSHPFASSIEPLWLSLALPRGRCPGISREHAKHKPASPTHLCERSAVSCIHGRRPRGIWLEWWAVGIAGL